MNRSRNFVSAMLDRVTDLKAQLDSKSSQLNKCEEKLKRVSITLLNRTIVSANRACAGNRFQVWKRNVLEQGILSKMVRIVQLKVKQRRLKTWQKFLKWDRLIKKVLRSMLRGTTLPLFGRWKAQVARIKGHLELHAEMQNVAFMKMKVCAQV